MKIRIALVGLIAAVAMRSLVQAQEPTPAPAIDRCRDFCARIYGEEGNEYADCSVACGDADVCHRNCKQKFGDDQAKVHRCLRTCMSHGRKPEGPPEEPGEPGEQPVKL